MNCGLNSIYFCQNFARNLDAHDNRDSSKRSDVAWRHLRVCENDDMIRRSLMDIQSLPVSSDLHSAAIHSLFRYKLLDILSDVLGSEKHPDRKIQAQMAVSSLPTRVEKVSHHYLRSQVLIFDLILLAPNIVIELAFMCPTL
jgi:hypothetical protein